MINIIHLTRASLSYYKTIDVSSSILLLIFLTLNFFQSLSYISSICLILNAILAIIIKYYSLRLSIDKQLFDYLAEQPNESLPEQAKALDNSLLLLQLSSHSKINRDWEDRCLATFRMIKQQFILFILQAFICLLNVLI